MIICFSPIHSNQKLGKTVTKSRRATVLTPIAPNLSNIVSLFPAEISKFRIVKDHKTQINAFQKPLVFSLTMLVENTNLPSPAPPKTTIGDSYLQLKR